MRLFGFYIIRDQPDHIVNLDGDKWTLQHSLECRASGRLLDCEYTKWLQQNDWWFTVGWDGNYTLRPDGKGDFLAHPLG